MTKTDLELWLIYKAFAAKRLRASCDEHTIDDVASEMYTIGLYREKCKKISRFNLTTKWLYLDAIKLILGREVLSKTWNDYFELCDRIDQMSLVELMATYQSDTMRGGGTNSKNMASLLVRELKRYNLTVNNEFMLKMNCEEIAELLNKQATNATASQVVCNLRKRGKRLFLIEGRLWETITEFSRSVGLCTITAKKRYLITPIKLKLMPVAKTN